MVETTTRIACLQKNKSPQARCLGGLHCLFTRCVSVAHQWLGTGLDRLIALGAGQVAVGDRVIQEVGYPRRVCCCIGEKFLHGDFPH